MLLKTCWDYTWRRRYMVILGIAVAILTVSMAGSFQSFSVEVPAAAFPFLPERAEPDPAPEATPRQRTTLIVVLAVGGAVLVGLGVGLHAISRVAQGALIAAVQQLEEVGTSSFENAWLPAWRQGRSLLALSLITNLPLWGYSTVLLLTGRIGPLLTDPLTEVAGQPAVLGLAVAGALSATLGLVRTFAERATVLEGATLGPALGRGLSVLSGHLPQAAGLHLLLTAARLLLHAALFITGRLAILCIVFWLAMIVITGVATAFFSVWWTLLWRQWAA